MFRSSTREADDPDSSSPACLCSRAAPEPPLLLNRQRAIRADWEELRDFLRQLSAQLTPLPFGVCLLSDRAIRRYNRVFRRVDRATDVLSFPDTERRENKTVYLGDILISAETAQRNARRYGLRVEEEMKVLLLHGLLHLLGYDHETDRGRMARLERGWSARLGLSQGLIRRSRRSPAGRGLLAHRS